MAALRRETSALREGLCHLRKMSPSFRGGSLWISEDVDLPILLGHSGVGPSQASLFAENLIRHFPIGILLPIGFAGGLQPRLQVGEIFLADRVRYQEL
ncbi:MAG TPA: hypothetical protein VFG95_05570, partial [Nitrospiria bacterium]|nr:hypothetical protein [Nitrospiria bacterium]